MKLTPLRRDIQIRSEDIDLENRTLTLSFSSEMPVDRWFGKEVLDHTETSVRLDRLNNGANLLFNHRADDVLGVIEGATIGKDKRGYAKARIAKTQRGDEILGLIEDKILRNVSFLYRIYEIEEDKKSNDYRAIDWEPMEISIVTIPADHSVGIGRSAEFEEREVKVLQPAACAALPKGAIMAEQSAAAGESAEIQVIDNATAVSLERQRNTDLTRLGIRHSIDQAIVQRWIESNISVGDAAKECLKILATRQREETSVAHLDMSKKEVKQYNLCRALNAVVNKNWANAGFELEASQEIAKRTGKINNEHTFFVPMDIQKRDLIVGTSTMGGYLVSTGNMGFIELLRNRSVIYRMGATRLSGLQGSVTVPKQTAPGTGYWLATEATGITESQMVIGQLALSPKNVGAYTEISRQLLLQSSPDAEMLVMNDLAAVVGLALDTAALTGPGTGGQPTGITVTTGIGSVTITTATVTYANVLEFQTDAASGNALAANSGYVTTPAIASLLKQKSRFTNTDTPIWQGNILDGNIESLRAMSSNQITAGQLMFGDFSQVVIGEWGVLEVEANPYANFAAGIVGVRAFYSCDVGVRYPAAFSLGTGITA
jgi:HK97 family phage major capsid protein/HK97 family phage prohead protease